MGAMNKIKGTQDFIYKRALLYNRIILTCREISTKRGFFPIVTPTIEATEVFLRSVGETTDVVKKEMYTFLDKGNRSITLRPEGTAGVVRALIENKIYSNNLTYNKFCYDGSMFRYERPQAGRYREFHQFGVESFGPKTPLRIFEVIETAVKILEALGIEDTTLELNSLGDSETRNGYKNKLVEYFKKYESELCLDCKERLSKNPLRLLDCKVCSEKPWFLKAPKISDSLTLKASEHFQKVCALLTKANIKYSLNPNLVRGLDYYTDTVFEIKNKEGLALYGGGEFDMLVREMGGPDLGGSGFAIGVERLMETVKERESETFSYTKVFIITLDEKSRERGFKLLNDLRSLSVNTELSYQHYDLKKQFKESEHLNPKYLIIIGDEEVKERKFILKDTKTKAQTKLDYESLCEKLKEKK